MKGHIICAVKAYQAAVLRGKWPERRWPEFAAMHGLCPNWDTHRMVVCDIKSWDIVEVLDEYDAMIEEVRRWVHD